ncbi:hypothetical protein KUCAC02_036845 [Chaenocephalus aceratus]|nr:hypothetical protein KUCAC02_036845 [Chaenocephalus aceratus]
MEPRLQVIGENEALQQFFSDVSGVLDSSVAVDTSILEQLPQHMKWTPTTIMLPESPPDSSSEACSPAQIPEFHYESPYLSNQPTNQELFQQTQSPAPSSSCRFKDRDPHDLVTYEQLRHLGLTNTFIKSAPSPPVPSPNSFTRTCPGSGLVPNVPVVPSDCLLGSSSMIRTCSPDSKKRRRSESEEPSVGMEASSEGDGSQGGSSGNTLGSYQLLTWDQYRPEHWSALYDNSYQTLCPPAYHIDTDKGFNFSGVDESFVCQKKNHFQVTVHIGVAAEPQFVRTPSGPQPVDHFQIKVFGIKLESPSHQVTIEQSQPDRSKKAFHPVRVSLPSGRITKVTLGRLHFSETTSNNMRKKGKPNPDQRYFQMVVGLYAAVRGEESFLLAALMSEKVIVRASNPGQFEMDGDALWQRGGFPDALVCHGRVGINTDFPDEALVVCGNAKVMGAVMQPSDRRAKENIQEVDSEQQLRRITQMRIVEFDYKPQFASNMGIDHTHQTGIIAQEVKELLPSAVTEVGDVSCSDGEKIRNFLMVDKEQIFMENVGAVQQLSKLTDNLDTRIKELEVWNRRLEKLKSLGGSLRSTGKPSSVCVCPEEGKPVRVQKESRSKKVLRHKVFQASVFTLLATMAFCIISITAIYLLNLTDDSDMSPPGSWPPDVDFCELLYCDHVYCCPPGGSTEPNITSTQTSHMSEKRKEKTYDQMKLAGDWTNTTIQSFMIKESQQLIDSKYCLRTECGPGRYVFRVPVSRFVPVNMRVTLIMNLDESAPCSALLDLDSVSGHRYPTNTQGEHEWNLHVARLYHSSYHFRSTVAGQADCNTDHHLAGALFTDYHLHFYRRCTDS